MSKQMIYSNPSIKMMRMDMRKGVMLDIFSGGDETNGIVIDPEPDNSGQVNRSNRNVWDDQL